MSGELWEFFQLCREKGVNVIFVYFFILIFDVTANKWDLGSLVGSLSQWYII
jgi:hypothetical protein